MVINEIVCLLGMLVKKGWRFCRIIKICSWGGEEFNLIGLYEWVEENVYILVECVIVYVNFDIVVCGDYVLRVRVSFLFKQVIYKWVREVKNFDNFEGSDIIYDNWLKRSLLDINSSEFRIYNFFIVSDYVLFYQYLGVFCVDFGYWFGYGFKLFLYLVYYF